MDGRCQQGVVVYRFLFIRLVGFNSRLQACKKLTLAESVYNMVFIKECYLGA